MKKRAAVLLLAILLAATSSTTAMAAGSSLFTDLPESRWSYECVSDLVRQGMIKGYPDGSFRPEGSVTYGEAFKFILTAIGVPEPEAQPGRHWAYPYIKPALSNFLVFSFDAGDLDKSPTRREVAHMVAWALHFTAVSGDSPYDDCDDGYVVKLYEKGVMNGVINADGSRSFHPDTPISREEMTAVIWRMMNLDLTQGMFRSGTAFSYWVDVLEDVPKNPYTKDQFVKDEKGRLTYTGGYYAQGVDVSRHQGDIDWEAVAGDGIDFAIIRAGGRYYGRNGSGALYEDVLFDQNMQGAIAAGLDVGAYLFSNAITVEEAIAEADLLLSRLEPYWEHITYPVVCDWEYLGGNESRAYGVDSETITDCINAFCSRVREAGYTPMLYFNKFCGYVKMDLRDLKQYDFWFAEYTKYPSCVYDFQFWQYSSSGKVAGIRTNVDMDLCFVPFGKGLQNTPDDPEPEPAQEPDASAGDMIENG